MPDQIEEVEYSDYVEQVLAPTWSEETRQRYYATFPGARPNAPEEIPVEQPQNDFPEPYVEPEEHLLERPIPAHAKPKPLIVSPSRVGTEPLRTPLSGLMVPKVAMPFPRPAPPKVSQ